MTRDEQILSLAERVRVIAWQMLWTCNSAIQFDDLFSEGMVAAIGAVDRHNPELGSLHQYAERRIRGAMQDYLRDVYGTRTYDGELRLQRLTTMQATRYDLTDYDTPDPSDDLADVECRVAAHQVLDRLPKGVRLFLLDRYQPERPTQDLALAMGVTEGAITYYEQRALLLAREVAHTPGLDLSWHPGPPWARRYVRNRWRLED